MAINVFEPIHRDAVTDGTAIVLLNHCGSRVSEDTGRDAQVIADEFGVMIIAADRPGSTSNGLPLPWTDRPATIRECLHEYAVLGGRLDRQLESIGVNKTLIVGRSARAFGALVLTATESLSSQCSVFAAEPVASYTTTADL